MCAVSVAIWLVLMLEPAELADVLDRRAERLATAGWVRSVVADLRSGVLTWSRQELVTFAEAQER